MSDISIFATLRKPADFHVNARVNLLPLETPLGASISISAGNVPGCLAVIVLTSRLGTVAHEGSHGAHVADLCHAVKAGVALPIRELGIETATQQEVCHRRAILETTIQSGKWSRNRHALFCEILYAREDISVLSQFTASKAHGTEVKGGLGQIFGLAFNNLLKSVEPAVVYRTLSCRSDLLKAKTFRHVELRAA